MLCRHIGQQIDVHLPLPQASAPSCDHFGRHGEWKKYLATKILAKVANWRPTDLKKKLTRKIIKNT